MKTPRINKTSFCKISKRDSFRSFKVRRDRPSYASDKPAHVASHATTPNRLSPTPGVRDARYPYLRPLFPGPA